MVAKSLQTRGNEFRLDPKVNILLHIKHIHILLHKAFEVIPESLLRLHIALKLFNLSHKLLIILLYFLELILECLITLLKFINGVNLQYKLCVLSGQRLNHLLIIGQLVLE